MGKHGKKSTSGSHSTLKKIPMSVKSQVLPLSKKLMSKCTNINKNETYFDDYKEIYAIIQEIRQFEKDYVIRLPSRTGWDEFFLWCKNNGAQIEGITVKQIEEGNYGVVAEKDLQKNDLYMVVPEKIMMSELSALKSKFGPMISENVIMREMPNVVLALNLILELVDEKSFWKPYISILPNDFNTVLYFDIEEMELLQKSTIFYEALNLYRSIARQYAYFFQFFQHDTQARSLPIRDYFTYDLYRWAVSVIMTRQNSLPTPGGAFISALVPLWDMCNHSNGKPEQASSDFNLETNCLEAYSMADFKKGEEVVMFYGNRTNAKFFLHNGFVCLPNYNDSFVLKLGISKSDPLFSVKSELCEKSGIALTGSFELQKSNLIDKDLLLFLKINILKEDELISVKEDESLLSNDSEKCKEITKRAYIYLRDRASLLLKCNKTSVEEDNKLILSMTDPRKRIILQLLISEKMMLQDIINCCSGLLSTD